MSENISGHDGENSVKVAVACEPEGRETKGEDGCNDRNWRRKLVLTAIGAAVAGITRSSFDWVLNQFIS